MGICDTPTDIVPDVVEVHIFEAMKENTLRRFVFDMYSETAQLPSGKTTAVLQPLPRPPLRHSQRLAIPATAQPPVLLAANVVALSGLRALLGSEAEQGASSPELYVNLTLRREDMGSVTTAADSWGVCLRHHTCELDSLCTHTQTWDIRRCQWRWLFTSNVSGPLLWKETKISQGLSWRKGAKSCIQLLCRQGRGQCLRAQPPAPRMSQPLGRHDSRCPTLSKSLASRKAAVQ